MERIGSLLPVGPGDESVHHGARRRAQRYPLNAEVRILHPSEAKGVVINASAGGLRVAVDGELPLGELCVLEVRFTRGAVSVEHARVVWAAEHPDGWIVGLEFAELH